MRPEFRQDFFDWWWGEEVETHELDQELGALMLSREPFSYVKVRELQEAFGIPEDMVKQKAWDIFAVSFLPEVLKFHDTIQPADLGPSRMYLGDDPLEWLPYMEHQLVREAEYFKALGNPPGRRYVWVKLNNEVIRLKELKRRPKVVRVNSELL